MTQKITIILMSLFILCGCEFNKSEYSNYEHYNLSDYPHKEFLYTRDDTGPWYDIQTEKYAIAVLNKNGFKEGIFYEVEDQDYILLDRFDGSPDEYDIEYYTQLYKDKIYIVRGLSMYEFTLDKENTKRRDLQFDYSNILDNYKPYKEVNCSDYVFGFRIDNIDDDYIYFRNVQIRCVDNLIFHIKCSLTDLKCEEVK